MKKHYILLTIIFCLQFLHLRAQVIDNTQSFKDISSPRYIRLNYENDFFSATDKYYTQGVNLEVIAPALQHFFLSRLLCRPHYNFVRFGVGVEHDGYTPTNIDRSDAQIGDRPFAGCLYLKTFAIAVDTVNKQRFSTTLSTGVIGPAALAAEMQTGIHRALHNVIPKGWPNQIHNDAILNYQINYEKQLIRFGRALSVDADGIARAGTLSDKVSAGLNIMLGYFDSPFGNTAGTGNNFRIYAYEHPQADLVGYDATLQGGMFDRTSPYTISPGNIQRVVFQNRFGFVVQYRRIYLEYFQSLLSSEFTTGDYHVWGGVQVAVGL